MTIDEWALQCGRGVVAADNAPGKLDRRDDPSFNAAAAWSPRITANSSLMTKTEPLLQCGRGVVAADNNSSTTPSGSRWSLQCGRGVVAADNLGPGRWPAARR